MTNKQAFDAWMNRVDYFLNQYSGIESECFPEISFRCMFNQEYNPKSAAIRTLSLAGINLELVQ